MVNIVDVCIDANMFLPSVGDMVKGQLLDGGIEITAMPNDRMNGVTYKYAKNKIYIDGVKLAKQVFIYDFKDIRRRIFDRDPIKDVMKTELMNIFGTVFYYGVFAFNRYNRGELIRFDDVRKWYFEFMYRCIYEGTGQLTTVSRKAAALWYTPFLHIILEIIEIPTYHGYLFTSKDVDKMAYLFNKIHIDTLTTLDKLDIDQPSLDSYKTWFLKFNDEYKKCFKVQGYRIDSITPDTLKVDNEFEIITYDGLKNAYQTLCPTVDVIKNRLPSPLLRELFITAEPLAQSCYAATIKEKIHAYPEWQKIIAKGLSFLTGR